MLTPFHKNRTNAPQVCKGLINLFREIKWIEVQGIQPNITKPTVAKTAKKENFFLSAEN